MPDPFCQDASKEGNQGELVAVFQFLNQDIERKFVAQGSNCPLKGRRCFQTVSADLSIACRQGAARAERGVKPGQTCVASWTEGYIASGCATQQALTRQQVLRKIYAAVQNG